MFVPFVTPYLTKRSDYDATDKTLERRRGGGGGGKSGGGGSSSGGGSSGGGGGRSGGSVPVSGAGGSRGTASSYGNGGGKVTTIGAGSAFAGRQVGGGQRSQVYGSRTYGSGYPGYAGYGVAGRGFPFVFWPLAWGGGLGFAGGAYLHNNEYGRPDNSSRPGGPMTQITFVSASPSSGNNSTFFVLADNTTTASLLTSIWDNCTSVFSTSLSTLNNSVPLPYNDTVPGSPQPEQAVQYYRASSVVLTLNGYNDTAALANNVTGPVDDVPLPGNTDQNLLNCLNYTIGAAVPLIDSDSGASVRWQGSAGMGSMGLLWIVLYLVGSMI